MPDPPFQSLLQLCVQAEPLPDEAPQVAPSYQLLLDHLFNLPSLLRLAPRWHPYCRHLLVRFCNHPFDTRPQTHPSRLSVFSVLPLKPYKLENQEQVQDRERQRAWSETIIWLKKKEKGRDTGGT